MTRVAIYARVSTRNQDTTLQIEDLTAYAELRKWKVIQVFSEKVSGTKDDRKEFKALMDLASKRKIDIVLTWKLDRFGRSLKHLVTTLAELESLGVSFVSLKDNVDFTTPSGRFQAQILGAVAEFEASMIRMRVKSALDRAKAMGVKLGPPTTIDPKRVVRLFSQGLSPGKIAKLLECSRGGVRRILRNLEN